jgi:hypothetical protein
MIGTLMKDILKVFSRFRLDHHQQIISIHLVELSQTLRMKQYQELVEGTHSKNNHQNGGHSNSLGGDSKLDESIGCSVSSSSSSNGKGQLNISTSDNDDDGNNDSSITRNSANKYHQDNVDIGKNNDAGSIVSIKDSQGYRSTIYPGITIHWHSFLNQVPSDAPDLIIG